MSDLIVLVLVALLLMTFAAAAARHGRSVAYLSLCSSQLRQIDVALRQYVQTYGEWPRTRYDPATAHAPTAYTNPNAADPFATDGPAPNDVTAAYHVLIRSGAPASVFNCRISPTSGPSLADAVAARRANFVNERELNYSFANPYPTPAAVAAGYRLGLHLTAEFAVAADMNPGGPALLTTGLAAPVKALDPLRSYNHREGTHMNVLYGDGHVEAMDNPFVGLQRDNIFTFGPTTPTSGGTGIVGSPASAADSVLLPTADLNIWQPILAAERRNSFLRIAVPTLAIVVGVAIAGWIIRIARRGLRRAGTATP